MDSTAKISDETRSFVRLPSAIVAVGLFAGLFVLGDLPFYLQRWGTGTIFFQTDGTISFGLPFGLASALAIVAFMLTVIVINRPVAIFIGVAAGTASLVAHHYWTYHDSQYVYNWDLPRKTPDEVLVDAFLSSGVRFGLIGIAALLAGKYLLRRAPDKSSDSHQPIISLPSAKMCLSLLGVLLLIDLIGTQSPDWSIWIEVVGRGLGLVNTLVFVALFLAVFTIFRPWAFLLALLTFLQQTLTTTVASGCINNDVDFRSCVDEIFGSLWVELFVLMSAYTLVAYACRPWANRIAPDPHAHSGGDSISSSKLPAGSRT